MINLAERRRTREKSRARGRPPGRTEIHITLTPDGQLTYTCSNVSRRNAYKMLQGCFIMAGEMFEVLGPVDLSY